MGVKMPGTRVSEPRHRPERGLVAMSWQTRSWRWRAVGKECCFVALSDFQGVNAPTVASLEPSLWCH